MSAMYLLIPVSMIVAAVFLGWFIWAVRSGQYEDTCTPALRILADEEFSQSVEKAGRAEREGQRDHER